LSYNSWAVGRVYLRVIKFHYIDRARFYELNGAKIIILGGLDVEIINVHVFAHEPGLVYYVLHIICPGFLFYNL
jgi:hypothetical protein